MRFLIICCLVLALILVKAQGDDQINQDHGGRFERSPYHHESGGSSESSGGSGGHHDNGHVEYGAHTGEKGEFEWHSHHPVHTDH